MNHHMGRDAILKYLEVHPGWVSIPTLREHCRALGIGGACDANVRNWVKRAGEDEKLLYKSYFGAMSIREHLQSEVDRLRADNARLGRQAGQAHLARFEAERKLNALRDMIREVVGANPAMQELIANANGEE